MDFVSKFNYIKGRTPSEEKAASLIMEEIKKLWHGKSYRKFSFDTWEITKAELTITEPLS